MCEFIEELNNYQAHVTCHGGLGQIPQVMGPDVLQASTGIVSAHKLQVQVLPSV